MSLKHDMEQLTSGDQLATAFPNAATVYEAWFFGKEIPDLPYDGEQ